MTSSSQVSPPLLSSILYAGTAQSNFLDLIIRLTFGEEYRPCSSSLCSFPHSLETSFQLGTLSILYSNNFSLCCSLNLKTKFCTHGHIQYINKQRYILFASVLDIVVMFITPEYHQECFFLQIKRVELIWSPYKWTNRLWFCPT